MSARPSPERITVADRTYMVAGRTQGYGDPKPHQAGQQHVIELIQLLGVAEYSPSRLVIHVPQGLEGAYEEVDIYPIADDAFGVDDRPQWRRRLRRRKDCAR